MPDAPDTVLERIQKLLNLAAKNSSEGEAASAMAKAMELCEEWNLDVQGIQSSEQKDGRRERAAVDGGIYKFQQDLWHNVAHLNFCLWWNQKYRNEKTKTMRRRHVLVGRKVNVAATRAMATYLQDAIERLVMERLGEDNNQRWSRWAVSYRKGASDRICRRLQQRRRERIAEDAKRQEEALRQAHPGSTSTAMVLSTYIDEETDANNDFLYGRGWSAAQAAQRAADAAERAERQAAHARWAAAHPEEARKQEEERRAEARKWSSRYRGGGGIGSRGGDDGMDWSAYHSGAEAGDRVSLEPQVREPASAGRIGSR